MSQLHHTGNVKMNILYIFTKTFANTNTNKRTNTCGSRGCLHCLSVIAASHVNSKQLNFDANQVKIDVIIFMHNQRERSSLQPVQGEISNIKVMGIYKCTGT